jgi:ribonuclease BN (tRNA processing enzyme)
VDLLLGECSFLEDPRGTRHLDAASLARLARAARARHLVATHSYFDVDAARLGQRLAAGFDGRISLARDGSVFEV